MGETFPKALGWLGRRIRREVAPPEADLLQPRQRHWQMLWVSAGVALAACLMTMLPDGHVGVRFLPGAELPGLCLSQRLLHMNCPGCGLTRSFILLAHGDAAGSWHMHRLGWLLALLTVLQIPYRIVALRWPERAVVSRRVGRWIGWGLILAMIGNWVIGGLHS